MDLEAQKALLLATLERAADQLGDVTPHVMQEYYKRFPEALELFEHLHPGGRANLEGQMVEQVLYCLMEWFESPAEIEIILVSTIPHHLDTLGIKPPQFFELVATVFDVIEATIPASCEDERISLSDLRQAIAELIEQELEFAALTLRRQQERSAANDG